MALDLPIAPHTSLFREIDRILRKDTTLTRVGTKFRSWNGDAAEAQAPSSGQTPWIRLTPVPRPMSQEYPDAQVGDLSVQIEVVTAGLKIDDCMNLFHAAARALLPNDFDAANVLRARLVAAGSQSGVVRISQPAFSDTPKDAAGSQFTAVGLLSLDVQVCT